MSSNFCCLDQICLCTFDKSEQSSPRPVVYARVFCKIDRSFRIFLISLIHKMFQIHKFLLNLKLFLNFLYSNDDLHGYDGLKKIVENWPFRNFLSGSGSRLHKST